jgi:hypothetical protein
MSKKPWRVERPFKYFGWDEPPIGKYKQPIKNDNPTGSGYPQEGIDNDNVLVKGRWPSGTKKKHKLEMKGTGAAERGKKFYENTKRYSVEE